MPSWEDFVAEVIHKDTVTMWGTSQCDCVYLVKSTFRIRRGEYNAIREALAKEEQ